MRNTKLTTDVEEVQMCLQTALVWCENSSNDPMLAGLLRRCLLRLNHAATSDGKMLTRH